MKNTDYSQMAADDEPLVMKELPVADRPYEKCLLHGTGTLSDAELLAVVIRTGSRGERAVELCRRIIYRLPGRSIRGLFQVSVEQLQEIKGIGRVKAVQLKCLAELAKRIAAAGMPAESLRCNEPEQVASYFMAQMRDLEKEEVRMLVLDGKNAMTSELTLSVGTFNASMAEPREIFYYALQHKAVRIILVHNHPSGDPVPSQEDIILTKRVAEAGRLLGIELLDHIVIGAGSYTSFRESGYF